MPDIVIDVSVFIDSLFVYDTRRSGKALNLFKLVTLRYKYI